MLLVVQSAFEDRHEGGTFTLLLSPSHDGARRSGQVADAFAEAENMERIARAAADRTARVGVAEALAVEEQVRAYGGPLESLLALALTAKLDDLRSQLETNPEGPRLSAATDP